jgi:hypothetical protein
MEGDCSDHFALAQLNNLSLLTLPSLLLQFAA